MRTGGGYMAAWALGALAFVVCLSAAIFAGTPGSSGDATADRVIGQVDFTKVGTNMVDASGLDVGPATFDVALGFTILSPPFHGVAVDTRSTPNHVYQADTNNSRVLGWKDGSAFTNGAPADVVIGQPDFYSFECNGTGGMPFQSQGVTAKSLCVPTGVAIDSAGNVYVSDYGNSRVLKYKSPFVACSSLPCVVGSAVAVIGQGTGKAAFTSNRYGTGRSSLSGPIGIAVDKTGNVFVADTGNNRVLEFKIPIITGSWASAVFGQAGFQAGHCNGGTAPGDAKGVGADSLCNPLGVAVDAAGNLWVADHDDNRVLEYDNPSASLGKCRPTFLLRTGCPGDTVADYVLGQNGSFVSIQEQTTSADSITVPVAVAIDAAGNLYAAESTRILEFDNPLAPGGGTPSQPGSPGDGTADMVFGQNGDFTRGFCLPSFSFAATADTVCVPGGLAVDSAGDLFAVDEEGDRLLEYFNPTATTGADPGTAGFPGDTTADKVLGQASFITVAVNLIDARSVNSGNSALAIDVSSTPNHLYVADTNNNRVLGWSDAAGFSNGAPADIVIGQPNFTSFACDNGTAAGDVNGVGPDSLCYPGALAVDPAGNLWVGDNPELFEPGRWARVLEYAAPFKSGISANFILGNCGGGFTAKNCTSVAADSLSGVGGIAFDSSGNAWVADGSRVLEYNTPLTRSGDISANLVFGQHGSFTSQACLVVNDHLTSDADSLCDTSGIALDPAGNLYVVDMTHSDGRVLEYDNPLAPGGGTPGTPGSAGDTTADMVFGHPNFASHGCNSVGDYIDLAPNPASLCRPNSVAVDAAGNLYVSDSQNDRVVEYDNPTAPGGGTPGTPGAAGDTTADFVLGQSDLYGNFRSAGCHNYPPLGMQVLPGGVSADSLCLTTGVAVDAQGDVFVADTGDNRVLEYDQPLAGLSSSPAKRK